MHLKLTILLIVAFYSCCNAACQNAEDYPVLSESGEFICGVQFPVKLLFTVVMNLV